MFFPIISIALAASTVVSCSPGHHVGNLTKCDLSEVRMPVPPNQSTLVSPSNAPEYVTVGVGVQVSPQRCMPTTLIAHLFAYRY